MFRLFVDRANANFGYEACVALPRAALVLLDWWRRRVSMVSSLTSSGGKAIQQCAGNNGCLGVGVGEVGLHVTEKD